MYKIFQSCFHLLVSHGIPQHSRAISVLSTPVCRRALMNRALPQLSTTQKIQAATLQCTLSVYGLPRALFKHFICYTTFTIIIHLPAEFLRGTCRYFVWLVNGFTQPTEIGWLKPVVGILSNRPNSKLKNYIYRPTELNFGQRRFLGPQCNYNGLDKIEETLQTLYIFLY